MVYYTFPELIFPWWRNEAELRENENKLRRSFSLYFSANFLSKNMYLHWNFMKKSLSKIQNAIISRLKDLEKFRGRNFREQDKKPRKCEIFFL